MDYDNDDDTTEINCHGQAAPKVKVYTVAADSGWHVDGGSGGANVHMVFKGDSLVGFRETGGSPQYYTYHQGGDQTGDVTYTWPVDDGTDGEYLRSSGDGTLTWDTPAGGSGDSSWIKAEVRNLFPFTGEDTVVFPADDTLMVRGVAEFYSQINTGTWDATLGSTPWGLIRGEIGDTSDIVRGQISDSCNQVRDEIRDTSTVVWNDSAVVALRKDGSVALTANWAAGDFDITGLEKVGADSCSSNVMIAYTSAEMPNATSLGLNKVGVI